MEKKLSYRLTQLISVTQMASLAQLGFLASLGFLFLSLCLGSSAAFGQNASGSSTQEPRDRSSKAGNSSAQANRIVSFGVDNRMKQMKAILKTSMGNITIRFGKFAAPETIAHFTGLASGEKKFIDVNTSKTVQRPFYDGLIFHRTIRGVLIQTGCPFGTGRGGPGELASIKSELTPDMKFDRPGLVAMALMREQNGTKLIKDSIGSQFFITLAPMPAWDADGYTIFGEVESGMNVVQKIAASRTGPTDRPIKKVFLNQVEIIDPSAKPQTE
jgi:peptidyl-prolyl cis-trans isomerase A (cyclophilin A)